MKDSEYIEVVLPLKVPNVYTYTVPSELREAIQFGIRVEVPLRNKVYAGIVVGSVDSYDGNFKLKPIRSIIDPEPIIHRYQYTFWQWMASYYCCTIGEVMQAALPSVLKMSSETKIVAISEELPSELTEDEYILAEAAQIRKELTLDEVRDLLDRKSVYPVIRDLMERRILAVKEELIRKYKAKKAVYIRLHPLHIDTDITDLLAMTTRSKHQRNALRAFFDLVKDGSEVSRTSITELSGVSTAVIRAMVKKEIFEMEEREVSRIFYRPAEGDLPPLSEEQEAATTTIREAFDEGKPVLLQGVTGSGKTRIYMEIMQEVVDRGEQVLLLIPEIGLMTQMVDRLIHIFGEEVCYFHSRLNNNERAELWSDVMMGKKIVIGARSSLFLPFSHLGLIVVDEEHDASYKQSSPAPRYHARDAAVVLGHRLGVPVLMGSATPAMESHYNAKRSIYHKIVLKNRYGNISMPEIKIVDLGNAFKTGRMKGMYSVQLRQAMHNRLGAAEQAIIFQNRKGYAPSITCSSCGWRAKCKNCDVSLTFHKYSEQCKCHYCSYRIRLPKQCPVCGEKDIIEKGFGTERIAEELKTFFPESNIGRMDFENTRTKDALADILASFGIRDIDILVGTQMIAKGLDFEGIGIVGILNADSVFRYPDFRADERGFQLILQVAGRAGRRSKRGEVIIQTYSPEHPLIAEVMNYDIDGHIARVLHERRLFRFPPYTKMIEVEILHRDPRTADEGARYLYDQMHSRYGVRIEVPFEPSIGKLRNLYRRIITIKIERKNDVIARLKADLVHWVSFMKHTAGLKSVRVNIDVDPV